MEKIMKIKLIASVSLALLFGCTNVEKPLTSEQKDKILLSYINFTDGFTNAVNSKYLKNSHSINEYYPINITSAGGNNEVKGNIAFFYNDYEAIKDWCKIDLIRNDVKDDTSPLGSFFGEQDFIITNKNKVKEIESCIFNYLNTVPIKKEDLAYFLADNRIKENMHYPFLKDVLTKSMEDKKITYIELYSIYAELDKAINQNLSNKIDDFNASLKRSH